MRKLLPGLLAVLLVACESKPPAGPGTVTIEQTTTTTTTTTIPTTTTTTTSISTTTTTVPGAAARRYVAVLPQPNVPADMTLFFELLPTANGLRASLFARIPLLGVAENEYRVTGFYRTLSGITGKVVGELGESLTPLETGGEFEGTLTADLPGCTAERQYSGRLTSVTLDWAGGATLRDCPGSPLSFNAVSLVKSDAPPATTTIGSTTTTVQCSYALSPPNATVPLTGGAGLKFVIITTAGCGWTVQSFADWITVQPPLTGSGTASITYDVAPAATARQGTIVIAGVPFLVTQAPPPAPVTAPNGVR